MFHSDRGAQFTSADFRKVLDSLHMVQSFSKKGHPYDNAVMECFFKYLKKQELDRRHFQSLDQLKHNLLTYIDGFYNPVRPHSHNHGLSPIQAENNFFRLTSLFYVLFPFPFYYFPFRYIESFCVHQFGKGRSTELVRFTFQYGRLKTRHPLKGFKTQTRFRTCIHKSRPKL